MAASSTASAQPGRQDGEEDADLLLDTRERLPDLPQLQAQGGGEASSERPVAQGCTYHYTALFSQQCPLAKKVTEELERRLVSAGVTKGFLAERSVPPGQTIPQATLDAARQSEFVLLIFTPSSTDDATADYLGQTALWDALKQGKSDRCIPVTVGAAQIPSFLGAISSLRFSEDWQHDEEGWSKLKRLFLHSDLTHPDPRPKLASDNVHFPTAILDAKISNLRSTFMETESFLQLEAMLKEKDTAVLTGVMGEGKTTMALMLCEKLRQEGYCSVYYESVDDIDTESIAKTKKNLFVVIDSTFGSATFDYVDRKKWQKTLISIEQVQLKISKEHEDVIGRRRKQGLSETQQPLLLLLVCRDDVYEQAVQEIAGLPSALYSSDCRLNISSASSLLPQEKEQLLSRYSQAAGVDLTSEERGRILSIACPIGFPLVCQLFASTPSLQHDPVALFANPVAVLENKLSEMMREDIIFKAAMALLVLQRRSLRLHAVEMMSYGEITTVTECVHVVRQIVNDLPDNMTTLACRLAETLKSLCGGLLVELNGEVSFSHDSVRDAVSVCLGRKHVPFVAQHCSLAFINDYVHLSEEERPSREQSQSRVLVPPRHWKLFSQRLIQELEKKNLRETLTCSIVTNTKFQGQFVRDVLSSTCRNVVHGTDPSDHHCFLFWATFLHPSFLRELLSREQFPSNEMWQALFGCCVRGHAAEVEMLYIKLTIHEENEWKVPLEKHMEVDTEVSRKSSKEDVLLDTFFGIFPPTLHSILHSVIENALMNFPCDTSSVPAIVAADHGQVEVLETLFRLGMPVDVRGAGGETALLRACTHGHKDLVEVLVEKHGADIRVVDDNGEGVFHTSLELSHLETAQALTDRAMRMEWEGYMNVPDALGRTPFLLACSCSTELVRQMLRSGADVDRQDKLGMTCLHYVLQRTDETKCLEIMRSLVDEHHVDPDTKDTSCVTPLQMACIRGYADIVRYLTAKGINAQQHNASGDTALHLAALGGSLETVKVLVEGSHVELNAENWLGQTPVMAACLSGHLNIVQYLAERGCDMCKHDNNGNTILHIAVQNGSYQTVRFIVEGSYVSLEERNENGHTPLHIACLGAWINIVHYLIEKGTNLHDRDKKERTVFMCAVASGNLSTVQFLNDKKCAELESKDTIGNTPLLHACIQGSSDIVQYLVEKGCDTRARNANECSVLHMAVESKNLDTVKYLVEGKHADLEGRDNLGNTPLLRACIQGSSDIVQYLVEKGCDTHARNVNEYSVLHMAALHKNLDTVKFLVEGRHADLEGKDSLGNTPLLHAFIQGSSDVVQYLVQKGCDTRARNGKKRSVLHMAVASKNLDTVKFLVEGRHADLEERDNLGNTPLLRACINGSSDIVQFLVEKGCDTRARNVNERSVLHMAVSGKNLDTVKFLVEGKYTALEGRDKFGNTPLLRACTQGSSVIVQYLVEKGCDTRARNVNESSVLHMAVSGKNLDTVKFLVEGKYTALEDRNKFGNTPLLRACIRGSSVIVQYLVEKCCETRARNVNESSVLHMAVSGKNLDTVKFLVEGRHADLEGRDKLGNTALLDACIRGSSDIVQYLVEKGCDTRARNVNESSVLHMAVESKNLDTVKFLVEGIYADLEERDENGDTPLLKACIRGSSDIVQYLVEKGCDTRARDVDECSVLHMAVAGKNLDTVKFLVEGRHADLEGRGEFGNTPLLDACIQGCSDIVQYLVEKGCDTHARDANERSLLHLAVESKNLDTVKFLVEGEYADLEGRDKFGNTPLLDACIRGSSNIVQYLVEKGCDTRAYNVNESSVVHVAVESKNLDTVKFLVEGKYSDLEGRDNLGKTPLLHACFSSTVDVVRYLIGMNADSRVTDCQDSTILHRAAAGENLAILLFLMEECTDLGDINARDSYQQTPFLLACAFGHCDAACYFLPKGADVTAESYLGLLPFHYACWSGDLSTVKSLVETCHVSVHDVSSTKMTALMATSYYNDSAKLITPKFDGRVEVVRFLLAKGVSVGSRDQQGFSALHWAAGSGVLDVVKVLVEEAACDVTATDNRGRTPLDVAAERGKTEVGDFLSQRHGAVARTLT